MRNILIADEDWLVWPSRFRRVSQQNSSPVAIDDALTVFRGQGPIVVAVLDNDIDPDGDPLTLVSASAALGTATANPNGTVTYAAPQGTPAGSVQFDTVVYEIADTSDARNTGQINVTITEPILSVDPAPGNTLTVTSAPEAIEIVVTEPADFAGTYQVDPLDLLIGPVNLVPPLIEGSAAVGQSLSVRHGLWIHDLAAEPVSQSWQWRRAGADIPGATGTSYVMQATDEGQGITAVESWTDAYGARSATSAAVSEAFTPVADLGLIGWWDADDAATISIGGSGGVASWAPKAGGIPFVQGVGVREPQTGLRSLNGRNVLEFDGDDHLECAFGLPASGDVAFHMALIVDGTSSAFEAFLAFDATVDFQLDAENALQFDGRLNLAGAGTSMSLSGGPFAGPMIVSVLFDRTGTATAEVFINGISRGTTGYTQALDATGTLNLMTNRSQNASVDGAVAEVIVTSDVTNRAEHHAYLATKWGLV